MPDVDRFERVLRGQHWLSAYRLSFADENKTVLRDTVTKACAAYLRTAFPSDCLRGCPQIIFQALREKAAQQSNGSDVFLDFNRQLQQFDSEERDFAAIEIMKTAAQTVFTDLEAYCTSVTPSKVERCFSKQLVERVIRHCFLARVREGIALERSQSAEQQVDWEKELVADVSARAETMLKSFFRKRDGAIRAPKRLTRRRTMTMDELNKGLPVN
jgi:hypothetical protein